MEPNSNDKSIKKGDPGRFGELRGVMRPKDAEKEHATHDFLSMFPYEGDVCRVGSSGDPKSSSWV